MNTCSFTFTHYEECLREGLENGYEFLSCEQASLDHTQFDQRICVLRHDVDYNPERSIQFGRIEHSLGISGTYFFRVHANEYNPMSHEVFALIRDLRDMGHEIGVHVEPLDAQHAIGITPAESISYCKQVIELITGSECVGMASHNDWTPDNNLRYLEKHSPSDFGFRYEAYDQNGLDLFYNSTYLTDSHFWYWREFKNGELTPNDQCLCKHFASGSRPLYVLTHPHAWYHTHYHRSKY